MADLSYLGDSTTEQSFEPIPAGTYDITVDGCDEKISANGNEYLAVTFKVADGNYRDRLIWDQFNLKHPDTNTREISERRIRTLFGACGFKVAGHTDRLIGETLRARVSIRPESDKYPAKNVIKTFSSSGTSQPKKEEEVPWR